MVFAENDVLKVKLLDHFILRDVWELEQELLERLEKHMGLENKTLVFVLVVIGFNPLESDIHVVDEGLNNGIRTLSLDRGRISLDF